MLIIQLLNIIVLSSWWYYVCNTTSSNSDHWLIISILSVITTIVGLLILHRRTLKLRDAGSAAEAYKLYESRQRMYNYSISFALLGATIAAHSLLLSSPDGLLKPYFTDPEPPVIPGGANVGDAAINEDIKTPELPPQIDNDLVPDGPVGGLNWIKDPN